MVLAHDWTEQWVRIQNKGKLQKGTSNHWDNKNLFNKGCWDNRSVIWKKNKIRSSPQTIHKNKFQIDKGSKCKTYSYIDIHTREKQR